MLVCFASLMHICWAALLLVNQGGIHITATATLYNLMGPNTYEMRALLYAGTALLPMVLAIKPRWAVTGLIAVAPQLGLLVLSGISAIVAVTSGVYPDGTVRPAIFILMDQGIYILLPVLYAFESLDRFHDSLAAHAFLRVEIGRESGEKGEKGEPV